MMDLQGASPGLLEEDLANLKRINRYLGGARGILRFLRAFARAERVAGLSLLDVGTGSADLPITIARWAKRRGIQARLVGLEPNPVTASIAKRQTNQYPEISIVRGDGSRLPFPPFAFDIVFCSQLLHHLTEQEIISCLRLWAGLARRAVVVSDLRRHPLAYWGIFLLTRLCTRNAMTRNDAPLSVRRAFTLSEWREIFRRAEIGDFSLVPFFPFRVLAFFPVRRDKDTNTNHEHGL